MNNIINYSIDFIFHNRDNVSIKLDDNIVKIINSNSKLKKNSYNKLYEKKCNNFTKNKFFKFLVIK